MNNVISGAGFVLLATICTKVIGLGSHFVLGWILTPTDYGLFAIALSISGIVSILANGGSHKVLIQRGSEYDSIVASVFWYAFLFNAVAGVLLVIIGMWAVEYYDRWQLLPMLSLVAIGLLLTTFVFIIRAKLSIDRRFREVSIVIVASNLFRQIAVILLALLGAGVFSFVIPLAIEPVVSGIVIFLVLRQLPTIFFAQKPDFVGIFKDTKWIMLSSLAFALYRHGLFFIISFFTSASALGIFYFGYQLILSLSVIFTSLNSEIVFPSFAKISNDNSKKKINYLRGVQMMLVMSALISIFSFSAAEVVITSLWQQKWAESIPYIKIFSFMLMGMALNNMNFAIMGSLGMWKSRLLILSLLAIGDLCLVYLALLKGDLHTVSWMIFLYRTFFSICVTGYLGWRLRIAFKELIYSMVVCIFPLVIVLYIFSFYLGSSNYLDALLETISILAILSLIYLWLAYKNVIYDLGIFRNK